MADYLAKVPLRDEVLAGVGATLYLAASPDEYDGLSDAEFKVLENEGVKGFQVYEALGRLGVPENLRLPPGFSEHYRTEVLKDMEIIRADPTKREELRKELGAILNDRGAVRQLYREGGPTYSGIISRIAGSNRTGKFYPEERRIMPHENKLKRPVASGGSKGRRRR